MKKIILISIVSTLVSVSAFAINPTNNSAQLKALGSAWKSHPAIQASQTQNDITIVYGGQDLSRNLISNPPSTAA